VKKQRKIHCDTNEKTIMSLYNH